jgi:hypothetical protein
MKLQEALKGLILEIASIERVSFPFTDSGVLIESC